MSKKTIASIILVLLAVGIVAAYVVFRKGNDTTDPVVTPVTFPTGSNVNPGDVPSPGLMTIEVQNDQRIVVKDFINNGATVQDPANEERYLLAGYIGYCADGVDCTATDDESYSIFFDTSTNVFSIGLLQEPLGESRRKAERFLAEALGIQSSQLCSLKYYIGTTYLINETYASDSVGFSMCEGAVTLPL